MATPRCPHCQGYDIQGHYCPSPEQIRQACEQLQAGWSETQLIQRRFGRPAERPPPLTVPMEVEVRLERR